MTYDIIRAWNNTDLVEKVDRAMDAGWKPQGGVSVTATIDGGEVWAQAMVRE